MIDVKQLLIRQAQWQQARARLSWEEKVRMAEAVREAVQQLQDSAKAPKTQKGGGQT